MLEIDISRLNLAITKDRLLTQLSDNTLRLVKYKKVDTSKLVKLHENNSYYGGIKNFNVQVDFNKLFNREIEELIYIGRTSANNYKILIDKNQGGLLSLSFRTLNEFVQYLNKESLK